MAFDLGGIAGGLAGLIPGGAQFGRIAGDVLDIGQALLGLGGPQQAQQQAPARPADQFQPAPQQAAAPAGGQDIGAALNAIMQSLQQIVQLLGGKGAAQQGAVGAGGQGAPAQQGGAAPAPAPAPQAQAPQAPVGGAAPQQAGGVAPQQGVNGNLALHGTGLVLQGLGELLQAISGQGPVVSNPDPAQSGGLSSSAGSSAVTTSGGYKIEAEGATSWKITGPDGKVTNISGDPHVNEGDGGKWDFKKDSTFVLGDGTRINVKTKDLGNGTSVTDALEITNNGQRAVMNGMANGKGKVETVDKGPEQFKTEQTFTMGKETDDWAQNGKEILGNDGGVDKFKLGNQLDTTQAAAQAGAAAGAGAAGGAGQAAPAGGAQQQQGGLAGLLAQIQQMLQGLTGQAQGAQGTAAQPGQPQPAQQQPTAPAQPAPAQEAQQQKPADVLSQLLTAIVGMLQALLPLLGGAGGKAQPQIQA